MQAAWLVALERWPQDGLPDDPTAWIYVTARRRLHDSWRQEQRDAGAGALEHLPAPEPDEDPADAWPDDRLALVFACCHPALAPEARVALTLRHVGGLSTAQVARAFLIGEGAMAQRLVRARRKLRDAGVGFSVPGREAMPDRLGSVLTTLYLIFTTGYAAPDGAALSQEAIRLARLVAVLAPEERDVRGLLALMLLHEARRPARFDDEGALVLLGDQDRSRWDQALIAEGRRMLVGAGRGRYALQGRVAAEHAAGRTDWPAVARLYAELARVDRSPVVRLNGAVATAEAVGPEAGLVAVDAAGAHGVLEGYHLFHSTRAELLRRLGRDGDARSAYTRALACDPPTVDRVFLESRVRSL